MLRSSDSFDDAEQIALSVGKDDEVCVFGIDPVHLRRAEPNEPVHLRLQVGELPIDPQVEMSPVLFVQVKSKSFTFRWNEKVWLVLLADVSEGPSPELRCPARIRNVKYQCCREDSHDISSALDSHGERVIEPSGSFTMVD